MRHKLLVRVVVAAAVVALLAVGSLSLGARPSKPPKPAPGPVPGPGPCPNKDIYCLDVWDPVTCDNGVTYSNQCYADRACATGCVPGGATQ